MTHLSGRLRHTIHESAPTHNVPATSELALVARSVLHWIAGAYNTLAVSFGELESSGKLCTDAEERPYPKLARLVSIVEVTCLM